MKYKAKVSFSGAISMSQGEVREISDEYLIKDLIDADYIEEAESKSKPVKTAKETAPKEETTIKKSKGKK